MTDDKANLELEAEKLWCINVGLKVLIIATVAESLIK